MKSSLYISIPCEYNNKQLVVKALGFKAKGENAKEALTEATKNSIYYVSFSDAEIVTWMDFRGRTFSHIEVPFDNIILDKINSIEPYPEEKKRKSKGTLTEPSAEEILKHAYPDLIK